MFATFFLRRLSTTYIVMCLQRTGTELFISTTR
uniref:Uncharacterized protein n=1 Tax=Anguilla anguilla TaxID=7936 RepID=A0A0E9RX88_ANGAN